MVPMRQILRQSLCAKSLLATHKRPHHNCNPSCTKESAKMDPSVCPKGCKRLWDDGLCTCLWNELATLGVHPEQSCCTSSSSGRESVTEIPMGRRNIGLGSFLGQWLDATIRPSVTNIQLMSLFFYLSEF